ncbi:GNAT family N-acetyltransferase [Marinifilum fragile]|uniref:GNAT family N-acetyltransferase n=1 Tax=Marinifilum fragile TaxID=570161 RepID=UPI0006D25957|nr:GNAT family N-acetyltransferase [Marinifilum fragile]
MNNIKIDFAPTKQHLKEIENWLIDEDLKTDEGFYCNWDTIVYHFENNELIIAILDNKVIGFIVYYFKEYSAYIDIAEIHPDYRKKGYGTFLVNKSLEYFISKDSMYVELHCSPDSSNTYWQSIGFTMFDMIGKTMAFKPLIKTLEIANEISDNRIELYCVRGYNPNRHTTNLIWNLEFKEGTKQLINPIIYPSMSFYVLRWIKDGKPIETDEVKYFQNRNIIVSSCVIIKELNENLINDYAY